MADLKSAEMVAMHVMDCVAFLHDGAGASGRRQHLSSAAALIDADRNAVRLALLEELSHGYHRQYPNRAWAGFLTLLARTRDKYSKGGG